ncbi:MAG: HlyD family secretion protein [Candidatus Omnitrophica bacterium]|nr:HlyD family secretion protein [Candidatus Omnitrophota bacterium]MDD5652923.1 HlyD family secretion protein [Candidatus Omnitrophota bacterium]
MSLPNTKKGKIVFVLAILGILLAGALLVYIVYGFNHITTDDAYIEGRIHSIAPKIPGTVKAVAVEDNQNVRKGEVLVEIDPVDYELKVNEAQANFDIRKASFEQAARDKERAEVLFKQEVYPKERYENTFTAYNLTKAQMEAAQAQLKIAQQNLEYTKIYAPTDGYVTKKSVETGNQLQAGQPLMAVIALDDIWVIANYKETQLKNVKPGQRVVIKIDTYPGKKFLGKVDSIMAGTGAAFSLFPPENALGNYVKVVQRIPVKIVFDKNTDTKHVLRIGMSCVPTIIAKNE